MWIRVVVIAFKYHINVFFAAKVAIMIQVLKSVCRVVKHNRHGIDQPVSMMEDNGYNTYCMVESGRHCLASLVVEEQRAKDHIFVQQVDLFLYSLQSKHARFRNGESA